MNKNQAIGLLNEIIGTCQSLNIGGFYTRPIRQAPIDSVELRLITSLDPNSRKKIARIIQIRGLKMEEENGLVIIYEPIIFPAEQS